MFSAKLTSRVLQEAHTRGLVGEAPAGDGSAAATPPNAQTDFWGMELASLVATGRMAEATLNTLAWEAIGGEAGSWVDPLFKGPAPIGDLRGLGDRYQDLVPIGEGASAHVFKGMDTLLQRHVAIKALKDLRGPILAEARAQAKVEHPNVCRVYEVGQGYLVMQLVEGPTLAQLAPSLDQDAKVRIVRDIALGVHAAHLKGLVHLDLKLNNVLMERHEDGGHHPVISDFGMVMGGAGEGVGGCNLGTPPYTSPEQLARDTARIGPGADVYALGVMMYVLLSGAIPFEAHDFPGLLAAMAAQPPIPLRSRAPRVPGDLARIVAKCLEKQPQDRYASARELAEDLDRFLRGEPLAIMGPARGYRLAKWFQRNRKVQWVGAAALAVLLVTLGVFIRHLAFVSQQAEWDHHVQKIVDELGSHLERTYRQPAHDIRPDLAKAAAFIARIEDARRAGGRAAQGPADLALGQAHYLLGGEGAQAAACFQRAWDAGYRTEGTRSWLTISLLAAYRKAAWSFIPGQMDSGGRAEEVRRRYLEPARRMLQGRGSREQVRLAYLVDLAEIETLDPLNYDRLLQVAQAYRSRFPDDLDAMFEEASVCDYKARLILARRSEGDRQALSAGEALAWWRKSRMILEEIRRLAPSLPRVYGALAEQRLLENRLPELGPEPTAAIFQKARALLDAGLAVRRDDPKLISVYASFLSTDVLPYLLACGQDPGSASRDLLALQANLTPETRERGLGAILGASIKFIRVCNYYGVKVPLEQVDACRNCVQGTPTDDEPSWFDRWCNAAQALGHAGFDPLPTIQAIHGAFQPTTLPDLATLGALDLCAAEHAWRTGGDPTPWISRAEASLARMEGPSAYRMNLTREIHLQRAVLVGDEAALAALRGDLAVTRQAASRMGDRDISTTLEFNTVLARRALAGGRDERPFLDEIRRCLQEPRLKNFESTPYYQENLATLELLSSARAPQPDENLAQALHAVDRALAQVAPPRPDGNRSTIRLRPDYYPDYQSSYVRILPLKAEILTALASRESRRARRVALARQALAVLHESLKRNGFLERKLRPVLDRARHLSTI